MQEEIDLKQRLIINDNFQNDLKIIDKAGLKNIFEIKDHSSYQKPLDLFMVCTGQDDQDGELQPLNVYTQVIQPKVEYNSNEQPYYVNFDENSYRNNGNLRRIQEHDGLIGYYSKKKQENVIQMLVCVTMYSEDRHFLEQTLLHIQKNLKGFKELGVSDFQVVVAVIYDGIMKTKKEVVDFYLELEREDNLDVHRNLRLRREVIQNQIDFLDFQNQSYLLDANEGLPPTIPQQISLLYQNRFQLKLQDQNNRNSKVQIISPQDDDFNQNEPALIVFSLFKHKNAKKLSSHLWFFEGLCRQTRPKYVCFVDVGTLPCEYGIVQFYKAMEGNLNIGGVCGFLGLEEPPEGEQNNEKNEQTQYINKYLKLAQVYEYATGHIIDKNFDSFLGFLHVLPGAWSAYRYDALELRYDQKSNFMQDSYFKSVLNPDLLTDDIKEANKFLAEDRILCLGIISAKGSNYQLKYLPDAYAVTDSPETLEEFIHQRRRWTNSMIFALHHVLKNYESSTKESSHSAWFRKIRLPINMFFAQLGLINYIFLPAFFLFMVLLSGYQFNIPSNQVGKAFLDEYNILKSCVANYELKEFEQNCNSDNETKCFKECQTGDLNIFQKIFNIFMKIFPFFVIITFILFMIICLTFKMKKQNFSEFLQLFRQVITEEDMQKIEEFKEQLRQKQVQPKEIETESNQLLQKLGEKRLKELKILFELKQSHKLPSDLQKIKSTYDKLYTQKYCNKIYKIFASLFSIESSVLMIIISSQLYINIFAPEVYVDLGFNLLPSWMRSYIIIILIINTGLFLLIMFFHLIFQPKLVLLAIKSYFSYVLYAPVYQIFLTIYSFCNLDDVTWGTKGLQNSSQNEIFVTDKVRYVKYWIWINAGLLLAFLCSSLIPLDKTPYVIIGIGIYGTCYNTIRITGGITNYLKYYLYDKLKITKNLKKIKENNIQQQEHLQMKYFQTIKNSRSQVNKPQEFLESYNSEDSEQLVFSRAISDNIYQTQLQQNCNKDKMHES
ncbi:chitin synthase (macronuclear) [Tetrahymena thermophila SB210]|uniref:chitin synthase n=1 Tax=Tetrahymena thermophila (strain SB210) TaxID=312017 RepID=Q22Z68_TETTS|nr:chitin synthase [Tetrahymena thermophila SB210]EAR90453.2 chitin synthase [Tetrahymena thermophila SB210]|eukprot:XP_001010698.2 chitin synthase [Tetrahymena thermophila SB210]